MNKIVQSYYLSKCSMKISYKVLLYLIFFTLTFTFLFCLQSCSIGLPTGDVQTNKNLFVDMGSFTVSYPVGDDWLCNEDRIKNTVFFSRYKKWLTGHVVGETVIQLLENKILADTFKLGEKESAEHYINDELRIMKEEGVNKGKFELEDVIIKDTILASKKFYCMNYKTSSGSVWERDSYVTECILALYFPPDYTEKRIFYIFHINDSKRSGSLVGQDAGQLFAVLKSFKLK